MKLKKAKDNEMLEAEITDEEVRESLKTSNKKAAPGGDGITFLVYGSETEEDRRAHNV